MVVFSVSLLSLLVPCVTSASAGLGGLDARQPTTLAGTRASAGYRLQILDAPSSGESLGLEGESSVGVVVGNSTTALGVSLPAFWVDGVRSELALPVGADRGWLGGLNASGMLIGQVDGSLGPRAFVSDGSTITLLPALNGSQSSVVDINAAGFMVGTSSDEDASFLDAAVMWTPSGVAVPLGAPKGSYAYPAAVNELNQVVGSTQKISTVSFQINPTRAFLWTDGVFRALPTLPGFDASAAGDINDQGVIVGALRRRIVESTAVIWIGGVVSRLPIPDDLRWSTCGSINNAGEITGKAGRNRTSARPFLLHNGVLTWFDDLIEPTPQWSFESGGIDEAGHITGTGMFRGERRAFVLTPP